MNITYKEKDQVLKVLCENIQPEQHVFIGKKEFDKEIGLPMETTEAILRYFERIGIVSDVSYMFHSPQISIIILVDAFDIFNRGGFTVREYLLKQEVEKLLLEIESLKPSIGDKLKNVTTIANNLASIAGTFISAASR
ncbi:MAG: hypothetical protein PF489_05400 [Salinivirgaceae bacterium]|nr:hypothetical protein [Salinivirgaceae bacterium]